jgi:hypothetical protein
MKWVLLAAVPVVFVVGIVVGRQTVSPPATAVELKSVPPSLPVVEPVAAAAPTLAAVQPEQKSNDADALAQQGLEAYVKGQYALSVKLCNQSLAVNERQPLALRILGAVDCKLKNREGAKAVMDKAPPQFRNFIRMVCHSEGIDIP